VGLDLAELEAAGARDPAGHEPFFGQDRFDVLVWRLRQRGLSER
jgi:hypothetical protein